MLEPRQFVNNVIRPALARTAPHPAWESDAAIALLLGTAAAESRLTYLQQHPSGPALGVYQMEPDTTEWLWDDYLEKRQPEIKRAIEPLVADSPAIGQQVAGNLYLATVMARVRYWTSPDPLPAADDRDGLGRVWKHVYNTAKGKGTLEHWRQAWQAVVAPAQIG